MGVQKIASLDVPVLITGPSGAGKEVVAQALHELGKHRDNSFVPLNCSLMQKNLLESELFGHKKGAFTGAVADKEGLCHTAHNGRLFLDEIGEMSESSQAKLLETGEYRRQGGTKLRRTNARLIAVTNRDLEQRIAEGHFRQDLFYRLSVISIEVPALSERAEDIPLLINHFMQHSKCRASTPLTFTPAAMQRLVHYAWPGNIRELRNAVERILILNEGDRVEEAMVAAMVAAILNQPQQPQPLEPVLQNSPFEQ